MLLVAAMALVGGLLLARGSVEASAVQAVQAEGQPIGWTRPTGPEMSSVEAARVALLRTGDQDTPTTAQTVAIRVAHGSFARLKAALDGQGVQGGPVNTGTARCFPGVACSPAEVERLERIEREMAEAPAYLIEIEGDRFAAPGAELRRGAAESGGPIESVILDAHNGFMKSQEIGDSEVDMGGLGPVGAYDASIEPATDARASSVRIVKLVRARRKGRVAGRLLGVDVAHKAVELSNKGDGHIGDVHVIRRVFSGRHGEFTMLPVVPAEYSIRALGCKGRTLRVKPGRTTRVTLHCTY